MHVLIILYEGGILDGMYSLYSIGGEGANITFIKKGVQGLTFIVYNQNIYFFNVTSFL